MPEAPNLGQNVQTQMIAAMKSGQKDRAQVLRMLLSEIKNLESDDPAAPPQNAVLAYAKKLRRAAQEYQPLAARPDAAGQAATQQLHMLEQELRIVDEFLPAPPDAAALEGLVRAAIAEAHITSRKQSGRVLGMVLKKAGPATDPAVVRQIIERELPE